MKNDFDDMREVVVCGVENDEGIFVIKFGYNRDESFCSVGGDVMCDGMGVNEGNVRDIWVRG